MVTSPWHPRFRRDWWRIQPRPQAGRGCRTPCICAAHLALSCKEDIREISPPSLVRLRWNPALHQEAFRILNTKVVVISTRLPFIFQKHKNRFELYGTVPHMKRLRSVFALRGFGSTKDLNADPDPGSYFTRLRYLTLLGDNKFLKPIRFYRVRRLDSATEKLGTVY